MRLLAAWIVTLFFWLTVARAGTNAPAKTNSYDGNWWLSAGIREQIGFLNGFRDCYLYEFNGPVRYSIGTPFEWQRQITAFFQKTPTQRDMPAAEFILRAHVDTDGKTPLEGRDLETHGPYDGLYWQQMKGTGGRAEQRGFISGYHWCHAELCKSESGTFSKTPDQYVALITRWYESVSQSRKKAADRQREKIAEVLRMFRDRKFRPLTEQKGAERLRESGRVCCSE